MKKFITVLLSLVMALTLFAGCAAPATTEAPAEGTTETPAEEPVEVIEVTLMFPDGDEGAKEANVKVIEAFNAAYPQYNITYQPGDGSTYSEMLVTKESVGEFPDIVEMRDTGIYVRAGKLAPLTDEVKALFTNTVEFDGVTYTAPKNAENSLGFYYNKAYFDANGLEEPTTYDEFIALCDEIVALGDMSPLVVGAGDIWHLGFLFQSVYGNNVTSVDYDFIEACYSGEKTFADETFKQTLTDLSQILGYAQEGWASTPDAQITTFFVNDMSAMMYSGTHMITPIAEAAPDLEVGWFAMPDRDGNYHLIGGGGAGGWALNTEAAAREGVQELFDEFMKFFFDPAQYKEYCETMSILPTTTVDPGLEVEPLLQEVIDASNSATSLGSMWNGRVGTSELPPDFRNFTYKTCVEFAQGTRDLVSAVEELQKTWDVAIQSFNPVTGVGMPE